MTYNDVNRIRIYPLVNPLKDGDTKLWGYDDHVTLARLRLVSDCSRAFSNCILLGGRDMKKTFRAIFSVLLAVCMTAAATMAVSARMIVNSSELPQIYAEFQVINKWEEGAADADSKTVKTTQFNVVVHNNADFDIKNWQIELELENSTYWVPEFWGFEQKHENDVFTMTALSWTCSIPSKSQNASSIGMSIKGEYWFDSFYATVKVLDSNGTKEQVDKATGDNDTPVEPTTTTGANSQQTTTQLSSQQPTQPTTSVGADTDPDAQTVTVKAVTPRRMSIRLEDGRVLKTGDSFELAAGEEIRFQMCANNWDNDTFDDNGNGLCGTVVYTFKVSDSYTERSYDADSHTFVAPKGDPALRTDVNKCFMAYRFGNTNGNYNKQTGIKNVVNTPLESLSVNLPLGSTVTADGYKAMKYVTSASVFVETAADKKLSYTDYKWAY